MRILAPSALPVAGWCTGKKHARTLFHWLRSHSQCLGNPKVDWMTWKILKLHRQWKQVTLRMNMDLGC